MKKQHSFGGMNECPAHAQQDREISTTASSETGVLRMGASHDFSLTHTPGQYKVMEFVCCEVKHSYSLQMILILVWGPQDSLRIMGLQLECVYTLTENHSYQQLLKTSLQVATVLTETV